MKSPCFEHQHVLHDLAASWQWQDVHSNMPLGEEYLHIHPIYKEYLVYETKR